MYYVKVRRDFSTPSCDGLVGDACKKVRVFMKFLFCLFCLIFKRMKTHIDKDKMCIYTTSVFYGFSFSFVFNNMYSTFSKGLRCCLFVMIITTSISNWYKGSNAEYPTIRIIFSLFFTRCLSSMKNPVILDNFFGRINYCLDINETKTMNHRWKSQWIIIVSYWYYLVWCRKKKNE